MKKAFRLWNCYAADITGRHSYDQTVPGAGKYSIQPVGVGVVLYKAYFLNTEGRLPGGLWQHLGNFTHPQNAASACYSHWSKNFGGKD